MIECTEQHYYLNSHHCFRTPHPQFINVYDLHFIEKKMFLNASHLYNMCFEGFASPLLSLLVHWYLLYVMYAFLLLLLLLL